MKTRVLRGLRTLNSFYNKLAINDFVKNKKSKPYFLVRLSFLQFVALVGFSVRHACKQLVEIIKISTLGAQTKIVYGF